MTQIIPVAQVEKFIDNVFGHNLVVFPQYCTPSDDTHGACPYRADLAKAGQCWFYRKKPNFSPLFLCPDCYLEQTVYDTGIAAVEYVFDSDSLWPWRMNPALTFHEKQEMQQNFFRKTDLSALVGRYFTIAVKPGKKSACRAETFLLTPPQYELLRYEKKIRGQAAELVNHFRLEMDYYA